MARIKEETDTWDVLINEMRKKLYRTMHGMRNLIYAISIDILINTPDLKPSPTLHGWSLKYSQKGTPIDLCF